MNALPNSRLLTFYLLWFLVSPGHSDTAVATFELKHRSAEEIITIIKPLLQPTDGISARDFQLFIRTDEATLAHIKPLITQLDTAPVNLLIRIKNLSSEKTSGIAYKKHFFTDKEHSARSSYMPEILTLEGHPVFIGQEHSIPSIKRILTRNDEYITEHPSITYYPPENGIYVTPRVSGDDVILTIESKQQILVKSSTRPTHTASTQIQGKLGEWLAISELEQTQTNIKNTVSANHKQIKTQERHTLYIKVKRIDPKDTQEVE